MIHCWLSIAKLLFSSSTSNALLSSGNHDRRWRLTSITFRANDLPKRQIVGCHDLSYLTPGFGGLISSCTPRRNIISWIRSAEGCLEKRSSFVTRRLLPCLLQHDLTYPLSRVEESVKWMYWRDKSEQPTRRSNSNISRAIYLRASRHGTVL